MVYYSSKTLVCRLFLAVAAIFVFTSSIHPIEGKICGPKLAQTLSLVCELYPTPSPVNKRAKDSHMNGYSALDVKDWSNAVEQLEDLSYARKYINIPNWIKALYSKDATNNVMIEDEINEFIPDGFRQGKRGIVEECCHNHCTLEHLIKYYCAKPSTN
ncbi:uncharacterized protein LOC135703102 [Ochlerotatus camptorhynchus]|uniref:uncharacterized protein LOC135703102 n=1 Tax=Ochlerotatus camptorhynchus TaxID=644619 RepID=UPI0031E1B6C7